MVSFTACLTACTLLVLLRYYLGWFGVIDLIQLMSV